MYESELTDVRSSQRDGYEVSRVPLLPKRGSLAWFTHSLLRLNNSLRRALFPSRQLTLSRSKELAEIRKFASTPSDINEHLESMFAEALVLRPKLIVELGVRGGTSTFVFERVAGLCEASIVSVDIEDCSSISSYPQWHFFRGDDVAFANQFKDFCRQRSLSSRIDLLFIDTSHYYDHTIEEIRAWFPLLSPRAKVIFHDTNMKLVGPRKDRCFELSWNNDRGVIRAIEEYLGIGIDETTETMEYAKGWLIRHTPKCNGLTIMDRVSDDSQSAE
jgi:cephalosporin hydroxylase